MDREPICHLYMQEKDCGDHTLLHWTICYMLFCLSTVGRKSAEVCPNNNAKEMHVKATKVVQSSCRPSLLEKRKPSVITCCMPKVGKTPSEVRSLELFSWGYCTYYIVRA